MNATVRRIATLLLAVLVPLGPVAGPAGAAGVVTIEDAEGRLLWGKGVQGHSPWSERSVWVEGEWIWSAAPIDAPDPQQLRFALPNLQDNILKVSDLFVYQQMKSGNKDTLVKEQEALRLRLRRHFDEGAVRAVRYAGGPGAWQVQVAYDLPAFESAIGFRAFSEAPRPVEPTQLEKVVAGERWWNRAWDMAWLATMGLAVTVAVLLVDATTRR